MTTPSTYNTLGALIRRGMRNAGKLGKGVNPSSEDYADGIERIYNLINYFNTQGIKLWVESDVEIPLVEGQASYVLAPGGAVDMTRPLDATLAYWLAPTGGAKTPLTLLSRKDYTLLSSVSQEGSLNSFFPEKLQGSLKIFFWMVPDATAVEGEAHVIVRGQITNPTQLNETMDFPPEWGLPLEWGYADQITTGQPADIVNRCAMMAEKYRIALENWDVEDAPTIIQVDSRMGAGGTSFR